MRQNKKRTEDFIERMDAHFARHEEARREHLSSLDSTLERLKGVLARKNAAKEKALLEQKVEADKRAADSQTTNLVQEQLLAQAALDEEVATAKDTSGLQQPDSDPISAPPKT